ncbi:MAG TPA: hypothetical protein VMD74_05700, partial [Candidatus Methylomirabilis sp.]|nr:hypothetical protein [Candidatus Methylomirabilis sp.]
MLEYLEKFNNLPADVKQKISSGEALAEMEDLEKEYGVDLAAFVVRVMVGDLYYKNLTANLIIEFSLAPDVAGRLARDLADRIFFRVDDYLAGSVSSRPPVKDEESPFYIKKTPTVVLPNEGVAQNQTSAKSANNFLEEDQQDIAAMGKITSALSLVPAEKQQPLLEQVVKEAAVSFPSAELQKRFREILSTYLRGVRTKVEVKENLQKEVSNGGLKMAAADADRILSIAQKKLAEEEQRLAAPGKVSARTTGNGTSFVFNDEEIKRALSERPKIGAEAEAKSGAPLKVAEYDLAALARKTPADGGLGVSLSGKSAPVAETKKIIPTPARKIETREAPRTAAASAGKKRIEDIKLPKIMNPIDELAYMDLVSFRRLDAAPSRRMEKIEAIIGLLEKQGIDKKIEGIRAWRNNPVTKTYLAMGQESISGGKNIDDIIKERMDQGLNYLTREEFEA